MQPFFRYLIGERARLGVWASSHGRIYACLQRVDSAEQVAIALGQRVLIEDWRNTVERHDERVVALNLMAHVSNHLVIRQRAPATAVELTIEVDGLLAGVGHVERIVGRLRIKHQSNLFALVHIPHQLFVLGCTLLFVARLESLLPAIVGLQFTTQHAKRASQVAFLEHSPRGKYGHENGKKEY